MSGGIFLAGAAVGVALISFVFTSDLGGVIFYSFCALFVLVVQAGLNQVKT